MKSILFAVAAACILWAPAQAAPTDPALAPFTQFVDAMNAGDDAKASAAYVPTAVIIDEFGPHEWTGFAGWRAEIAQDFTAGGVTDFHIALSPVSFKNAHGDFYYAVMPSTLTYKVKGKPTTEKGLFTISTIKTARGWRIDGWAWSTTP
jgi:ketosteroid isomerase-like protein